MQLRERLWNLKIALGAFPWGGCSLHWVISLLNYSLLPIKIKWGVSVNKMDSLYIQCYIMKKGLNRFFFCTTFAKCVLGMSVCVLIRSQEYLQKSFQKVTGTLWKDKECLLVELYAAFRSAGMSVTSVTSCSQREEQQWAEVTFWQGLVALQKMLSWPHLSFNTIIYNWSQCAIGCECFSLLC